MNAGSTREAPRHVSVAVPVPFLPALTYRVPEEMPTPPAGGRVAAPLGSRIVTGCVIGDAPDPAADDAPAATGIRDLAAALDEEPFLPPPVLKLALWVADYYACGPGETIAAALPPLALTAAAQRAPRRRAPRVATLTAAGADAARAGGVGLGARQRAALAALAPLTGAAAEGIETSALARQGIGASTLARLARRGLVTLADRDADGGGPQLPAARPAAGPAADPGEDGAPAGPPPTADQRKALGALGPLAEAGRFRVALLHGVTGSGKTEVYLRLARDVCARGRRVLVLVPEIALTPAAAATFRRALGQRVAVQHSGLTPAERREQWRRIRGGEVDVVVGTRSAVFAPLPALGLIVVDEEHDASYKQEESPRYHARDVAVVRGRQAGALVVLGSATPSLESYQNARAGRYARVVMAARVHQRPLAAVRVVDMRAEAAEEGPEVVLSRALREALADTLARGEQALLLLNRRGFASALLCRQCGRTLECPNCSVSLTLHRAAGRARCHYCNHGVARPQVCGHCAGPYLETVGFGTERVEAEFAAHFPGAAAARLDRDTVRRRGAAAALLERFARGDVRVLIGTQMIAKGHDFPNVTLVGVISADVGLALADFRASERTFQLLTQVAGRAGRGARPGEAVVQSFHPEHYSIGYACLQAYEPFFDAELRYRRALRYPPAVALVNAIVRGRSLTEAMADADGLARRLRGHSAFHVLGPAPAPMVRLRGQHRAQIFLKGRQRRPMREALLAALRARPELRRRVTVDIDPLSVR